MINVCDIYVVQKTIIRGKYYAFIFMISTIITFLVATIVHFDSKILYEIEFINMKTCVQIGMAISFVATCVVAIVMMMTWSVVKGGSYK